MESKLSKYRNMWWRVVESTALLVVGFAAIAGTVAMLIGQYLTLHHYAEDAAPWPIEHFFWTAAIVAIVAGLLGWGMGILFPKQD